MDGLVAVIAAIETGGPAFILFAVMIVVIFIALLITIAR
jgi:hypothetical protein